MNTPSGIITLTTDFGHKDPFVGVMKGSILSRMPECRLVDLSHEIQPHWPAEAGFWLEKSYSYFPAGTLHLAVVDPEVGTERAILIVEADKHIFLAPDNGLLAPILRLGDAKAYQLSQEWLQQQNWPKISSTFHGRDILGPITAEIAAGREFPASLGTQTKDYVPSPVELPERANDSVHGVVITTDHFGNLITNIEASTIASFRTPIAYSGGKRFRFHNNYAQCKPGEYLALVNSFDVVEISRSQASAAEGLGLGRGTPVTVRESTIGH